MKSDLSWKLELLPFISESFYVQEGSTWELRELLTFISICSLAFLSLYCRFSRSFKYYSVYSLYLSVINLSSTSSLLLRGSNFPIHHHNIWIHLRLWCFCAAYSTFQSAVAFFAGLEGTYLMLVPIPLLIWFLFFVLPAFKDEEFSLGCIIQKNK